MKYIVLTTSINRIVGATYVAVAFTAAIKQLGHEVWLASYDTPNDDKLRRVFGDHYVPPDKVLTRPSLLDLVSLLLDRKRVINTYADLIVYPFDYNYFHTAPLEVVSRFVRGGSSDPINAFAEVFASHEDKVNMCNSRKTQRELAKYGIHCKVVYPPVPPLPPVKPANAEKRYVGYFGRIDEGKKIENLLEVAAQLPDVPFVIAGKPEPLYADKLRAEIERRGLTNVRFIPRLLTAEEKARLLSQFRVVVHTNPDEPFGIAPLEAVMAGALPALPCKSGVYEVFEGHFDCWNTVDELVRLVDRLYTGYDAVTVALAKHLVHTKASFEAFVNTVQRLLT